MAAYTFVVCFSRLVWMLSSCSCFCLFSLDSRSWWTCSSFTFCRTRPDSPTVQSSSAQLISLCLGLQGLKSTRTFVSFSRISSESAWLLNKMDIFFIFWRERLRTLKWLFVASIKHCASWPALLLLDRSRFRQFLESWESVAGVKNLATLTLKHRVSTGLLCKVRVDLCQTELWQRIQSMPHLSKHVSVICASIRVSCLEYFMLLRLWSHRETLVVTTGQR